MWNIYNEETAFYSWKKLLFFATGYWHIHRFTCFRKEEDQNVQRWQFKSSIFKKDEEKQSEKIDCPVNQIQKCKKKQDSFRVCSFYIHSKSDVNTILDLIRVEKYVDNIQIFHLLWGLIWKILTGKYCEDSAWAECLKLYDKKILYEV